MAPTPAERWQCIAAAPENRIDLAEAALVIAAGEYRDLDVDAYVGRIEELAARLRRRLRQDIPPTETILALNRYLFGELGFAGNSDEYYDPRNSFLNEVIDRKLGIPITLSVVYIEVGKRLGLALDGVSFPGHFLVKCVIRDGTIVLDPYAGGVSLSVEDLQHRIGTLRNGIEPTADAVKSMIVAAGKKEILARMLRNLKDIYLHHNQLKKALSAVDRIIAIAPDAVDEYFVRGQIYLGLECFRAALADLQHYLVFRPDTGDAAAVRRQVADLQQIAARLN